MPIDDPEVLKEALRRIIASPVGIVKRPKLTKAQYAQIRGRAGGRAGRGRPSNNPLGRPINPDSPSRRKGIGRERWRAARQAGRVCAVKDCYLPVRDLHSKCYTHHYRQLRYGHYSVTKLPEFREMEPLLPVVRAYLKRNPIPAVVLEALQTEVLNPRADLSLKNRQGWRAKDYPRTREKVRWWLETVYRPGKVSPKKTVLWLLTLSVWMTERSWGRGSSDHIALGRFVAFQQRRTKRLRWQAWRFLGQLTAESIGVWLLVTARAVTEFARTWLPTRKQVPIVVTAPKPPQHPGQRPTYHTLADLPKIEAWKKQMAAYEATIPTLSMEDID